MKPEKLLIFVKRNNLLTTKKTHFMKKFGVVGLGATIATLTIQIQSNNNLKKAGISLKLK